MKKIIRNIALVLTVAVIAANTKLDVFSSNSKQDIQVNKEVECYQLAEDGDIQITFKDRSDKYINIYEDINNIEIVNSTYLKLDNLEIELNAGDIEKINANKLVEKELNKLPENLILDLKHNYNLEIKTVKHLEKTIAYGKEIEVAGLFTTYYNQNKNVIKVEYGEVEHALNHEIGHALIKVWALTEDEQLQKSFNDKEYYFANDYYYEDINEYIAEGIKYYYNDKLVDGDLKQALDRILSVYK